jgi:CHAD domain-containing protein
MIEILDILYEQHADLLYNDAFQNIRKYLEKHRSRQLDEFLAGDNPLEKMEYDLSVELKKIKEWHLDVTVFSNIESGLKRVYKRGRKALKKAHQSGAPDDFHEWRKRVKYLRYQLDLLNRIWPDYLSIFEKELHRVSDYLGTDRDLFMLDNLISKESVISSSTEEFYLLKSIIEQHQEQMKKHALALGQRIYHPKTSQFIQQMNISWEMHQWEIDQQLIATADLEF